jgi:uncharacterized protein (DUF305 family)
MNKYALGFVLLLILTSSLPTPARQGPPDGRREQAAGSAWSELEQALEKMHAGMRTIKPSGNGDVDFVRLMLPHHQAAIDMARAELAHGKDPQMRRLAQEIITDQQSEIELMQLWLKQHEPGRFICDLGE